MAQDTPGVRAAGAGAERADAPAQPAQARSRRRRSPFLRGLLCGIALLLGLQYVINKTALADFLVRPLVHSDTAGSADAIVVLGAGVVGPCEPNLHAVRRAMLAVRLWQARRAPIVVFTGGAPDGLPCAISEVMANLAVELGLPRDAVVLETVSRN